MVSKAFDRSWKPENGDFILDLIVFAYSGRRMMQSRYLDNSYNYEHCSALVQVMACHLFDAKPLLESMLILLWRWQVTWCQLCRHLWHRSLSLWQPAVRSVTTKLALWQRSVFHLSEARVSTGWYVWNSAFVQVFHSYVHLYYLHKDRLSASARLMHRWKNTLKYSVNLYNGTKR